MKHGMAVVLASLSLGSASSWLAAAGVDLSVVRIPERRTVELEMHRSAQIPAATMKAKINIREGQSRVEIEYRQMKSAVLFAGDVTCYVLWAVNRDGGVENLGELWVRPEEADDKLQFSTGLRTFALMVTAEPYYQVERPSELVIFTNQPSSDPQAPSSALHFDAFAPPPEHGLTSLANVRYDGEKPLDLLQAEKVFELAGQLGAEKYASGIFREARTFLLQAQQMSRTSRAKRGTREFARKSVASSNEAIKITQRELDAIELEQRIAERQEEMQRIQAQAEEAQKRASQATERAQQAESAAERLKRDSEEARRDMDRRQAQAREELRRLSDQKKTVENEKRSLEGALVSLRDERRDLQQSLGRMQSDMRSLEQEKKTLEGRLQQALSFVAETRDSARGMIVNLPDILFDVNEATLKPEARLVLAKLAGILLIMQDLNLRVEGHTDSTGTASYNLKLSQDRAESVFNFMAEQGIASTRMKAVGYGLDRPIADNGTVEGRRKNRRVEIVIAEGVIAEESGR